MLKKTRKKNEFRKRNNIEYKTRQTKRKLIRRFEENGIKQK